MYSTQLLNYTRKFSVHGTSIVVGDPIESSAKLLLENCQSGDWVSMFSFCTLPTGEVAVSLTVRTEEYTDCQDFGRRTASHYEFDETWVQLKEAVAVSSGLAGVFDASLFGSPECFNEKENLSQRKWGLCCLDSIRKYRCGFFPFGAAMMFGYEGNWNCLIHRDTETEKINGVALVFRLKSDN